MNKDKYRILCQTSHSVPLFLQPWYLDAATAGAWDVLLSYQQDQIAGVLVYEKKRKFGFSFVVPSLLTQYSGVYLFYPENLTSAQKYSFEESVCLDLIAQLKGLNLDYYEQNFPLQFTNWQPFYVQGYSQTTRYTYVIENIPALDEEHLIQASEEIQQTAEKSRKKCILSLDLSVEALYQFFSNQLKQRGRQINYSLEAFTAIYNAAKERGQGQILALYDAQKNLLAALFVVWDKQSAYQLICVSDPKFKKKGAKIRIIIEAIKFLKDKTQNYDFEGSMIAGIAKRNQSLGAKQVPFFNIRKSSSTLLSLLLKTRRK